MWSTFQLGFGEAKQHLLFSERECVTLLHGPDRWPPKIQEAWRWQLICIEAPEFVLKAAPKRCLLSGGQPAFPGIQSSANTGCQALATAAATLGEADPAAGEARQLLLLGGALLFVGALTQGHQIHRSVANQDLFALWLLWLLLWFHLRRRGHGPRFSGHFWHHRGVRGGPHGVRHRRRSRSLGCSICHLLTSKLSHHVKDT
mmetsp:Transcript_56993/g.90327  ORF Transcript_56993/g.90327 Transcript_56993/m.90327 type:complete len:202 (-) Transcript_56993:60-665(-)